MDENYFEIRYLVDETFGTFVWKKMKLKKNRKTDLEYWLRLLRVALGIGESVIEVIPASLLVDEAIDWRFRLSSVLAMFFQNFILIS